jgi:hypothetical protein
VLKLRGSASGMRWAVDLELAFMECGLQTSDELAAEDATEHLDRKEEGAA